MRMCSVELISAWVEVYDLGALTSALLDFMQSGDGAKAALYAQTRVFTERVVVGFSGSLHIATGTSTILNITKRLSDPRPHWQSRVPTLLLRCSALMPALCETFPKTTPTVSSNLLCNASRSSPLPPRPEASSATE